MGKIWMKAPDPSRQCCACAGKAGPCSSCCTGLVYDLTNEHFDTFAVGPGYLPFPATNCTLAQDVGDFYTTGDQNITLEILSTGTGPRSNALSLALRSGDLFDISIDTEVSSDAQLAQFVVTGGSRYNLVFPYYSGYSTVFAYPTGKSWGKVVSQTNYPETIFNPDSVFKTTASGIVSIDTQYGPALLDNIPPATGDQYLPLFSYADTRAWTTGANGYSLLSGIAVSDYNPTACIPCLPKWVRNPYPVQIDSPDTHYCPSGTLFPYVGYATDEEACDSFQVCAFCDAHPVFSLNWSWEFEFGRPGANYTMTGFGQTIDKDIQCLTRLIDRNKSLFEGLSNGNRPLCILPRLVADDPQNQTWVMGGNNAVPETAPNEWYLNGIKCDGPGPPRGNIQCLMVHWAPTLYYSTNWPSEVLPTINKSQSLQVQVTGDKCVSVMAGAGGVVTGAGFNYINQHITGYYYQDTAISLDFTVGDIRINPIYFHEGTTQVSCPFTSLP